MKKRTNRKPKKVEYHDMFAILNHVGGFWSHDTFYSEEDAKNYLKFSQKRLYACDLSRHKVIKVKVTIEQQAAA